MDFMSWIIPPLRQRVLAPFGFGDRWIYRDNYRSSNIPLDQFRNICEAADLLIMRAVPFWPGGRNMKRSRRRAFIDVDPGFTQITFGKR